MKVMRGPAGFGCGVRTQNKKADLGLLVDQRKQFLANIAFTDIHDGQFPGQLLGIGGMDRHFGLGLLARFRAHQFADAGPVFKLGWCDAIHEPNLAADGARPAAGKLERMMHFLRIVDHDEEQGILFRHVSALVTVQPRRNATAASQPEATAKMMANMPYNAEYSCANR